MQGTSRLRSWSGGGSILVFSQLRRVATSSIFVLCHFSVSGLSLPVAPLFGYVLYLNRLPLNFRIAPLKSSLRLQTFHLEFHLLPLDLWLLRQVFSFFEIFSGSLSTLDFSAEMLQKNLRAKRTLIEQLMCTIYVLLMVTVVRKSVLWWESWYLCDG